MYRLMRRCVLLLCVLVLRAVSDAAEPPAKLPLGSAVMAKHPGVKFRVKNNDLGEMHAGLVEHVRKVQGEWLWLGRGWVPRRDVVPLWDAVEYFTAEIEQKPTAFCYVGRARAAAARGGFDAAAIRKNVNDALALDPNFAAAHWARALCFNAQDAHERAIECYDDAIWLDPRFAEAYAGRGATWALKLQVDHARKDIDRDSALPEAGERMFFTKRCASNARQPRSSVFASAGGDQARSVLRGCLSSNGMLLDGERR